MALNEDAKVIARLTENREINPEKPSGRTAQTQQGRRKVESTSGD
jgi:hypothetical protein